MWASARSQVQLRHRTNRHAKRPRAVSARASLLLPSLEHSPALPLVFSPDPGPDLGPSPHTHPSLKPGPTPHLKPLMPHVVIPVTPTIAASLLDQLGVAAGTRSFAALDLPDSKLVTPPRLPSAPHLEPCGLTCLGRTMMPRWEALRCQSLRSSCLGTSHQRKMRTMGGRQAGRARQGRRATRWRSSPKRLSRLLRLRCGHRPMAARVRVRV